jgi:hypothetical protein
MVTLTFDRARIPAELLVMERGHDVRVAELVPRPEMNKSGDEEKSGFETEIRTQSGNYVLAQICLHVCRCFL